MMINLPAILIGLVYQKVFIKQLGAEYLGISGLFTNIVSMLSIAELGIGTSIIFHLYYPVSQNDEKRIKELVSYYKKCYRIVLAVIAAAGALVMPFIPVLVGTTEIRENIYLIYFLFWADCAASYCFVYRQSILIANQYNYIVNIGLMACRCLTYLCQMSYLELSHNYYGFLIIGIILRIADNMILAVIAGKKYPMLRECGQSQLNDQKILSDISKKIKASVFHRVGSFIVIGSDNILISLLCGISTVGFYSNYNMIISALRSVVNQCFNAVTSGVGNMLVTSEHSVQFTVYRKIRFLNYIIASFVSLCLYGLMDSWICIWIGKEWLLQESVLVALTINLFLNLMRNTMSIFKDAAGIVYEDRFVPLIECMVNIVCSIAFFQMFGIAGIFVGTICSNLVLHVYSYPYFVYHKLFYQPYFVYYSTLTKESFIFLFNLLLFSVVKEMNGRIASNFFIELFFAVLEIAVVLLIESALFYWRDLKLCDGIFRGNNKNN